MPYYEITYETGRMSVAEYKDDEEALNALGAHHFRAVNGEVGGPIGQPAERIAAVRVYKVHPNELNPDQTMTKEVLHKEVGALIDSLADENGVVLVDQLSVAVRGLTHPMVVNSTDKKPFASQFLMKEDRVLAFDPKES